MDMLGGMRRPTIGISPYSRTLQIYFFVFNFIRPTLNNNNNNNNNVRGD